MYWKIIEWERTKQEMQGKGMFNEMAKNVKCFSKKQTPSEEDRQWSLRMLLSKMQVEILQHRKSWRDSGDGKEPRSGRCTDASGCTGATPALETSHWEDALTGRKKTGEKPLCPTDGAAEDMGPSLCQLPLTHPLAALRHWVKVPAPQCAHMKWPIVSASGGAKEKSLMPVHPFYEISVADTVSSSVGSLYAKDCNVQHSNPCKEFQRATTYLKGQGGHPRSPPGWNREAWTPRVGLTTTSVLWSQVVEGNQKGMLKISLCIGRSGILSFPDRRKSEAEVHALQESPRASSVPFGQEAFLPFGKCGCGRKGSYGWAWVQNTMVRASVGCGYLSPRID